MQNQRFLNAYRYIHIQYTLFSNKQDEDSKKYLRLGKISQNAKIVCKEKDLKDHFRYEALHGL